MEHSIALVTGSTSGLGHAAAFALDREGWHEIIVTGRSLARIQETAVQLAAEAKRKVFTLLELELDKPSSAQSAIAELVEQGRPIDFLLLNAGLVGGKERVLTTAGVEASQAPLIGHHQLTMGLLRANLLSPNARIVISGAELAQGGVPMFSFTDVAAFAAKHHRGGRTAAIEALLRNGPNVKYEANRAYAVAPGSAPDTKASRNAGLALKWVFIPLVKLIPGMTQTPKIAARRYLQASEFGTDVSGQFFASAPKRLTGPLEAMRHPHFHDPVNQEASWQAVVKVSGVDLSYPAPLSVVS